MTKGGRGGDNETVLPVRRRLLMAADGGRTTTESVFCPARRHSTGMETCKNCVHAHFVSPERVVCTPLGRPPGSGMDAPAGSAALSRVLSVQGDVPGVELVELWNATPWRLPVVDHADRFIGFVSSKVLGAPRWPWQRVAVTRAHECVAGASLNISETEPLGRALRFMARHGTRSLALVDASGALQGVLSDVDALRTATHGKD